jgi:hypothetical protein
VLVAFFWRSTRGFFGALEVLVSLVTVAASCGTGASFFTALVTRLRFGFSGFSAVFTAVVTATFLGFAAWVSNI